MNIKNQGSSKMHLIPIYIAIAMCLGLVMGLFLGSDFNLNFGVNEKSKKFREVLSLIEKNYVDKVDSRKLTEDAIADMLTHLDPHTVYIPKEDVARVESQLANNFEGIGIEFDIFRDTLVVLKPIPDGPSFNAGIQSGDKIVMVDGQAIGGAIKSYNEVYELLLGDKGTEVRLSVYREGFQDLISFTLKRAAISRSPVSAHFMVDKEIGYIKLDAFTTDCADIFKSAFIELREQGMKKLIFDLQNNGGGLLTQAIDISDFFIEGNAVIMSTQSRNSFDEDHSYKAKDGDAGEEIPLTVLINANSASASEIVAGALQDNDRAILVGRRSFGKGLVQNNTRLSDGSRLRLTVSRYYTPSGRSIQKPYMTPEEYEMEVYNRKQGLSDSLWINDSLAFKTIGGRIVYGGGGITPDIYVRNDTTYFNELYSKIIVNAIHKELCLWIQKRKLKDFKVAGFKKFKNQTLLDEEAVKKLKELLSQYDIVFKEAEYIQLKNHLDNLIRSLIADSIWGKNEFQEILLMNDPIYLKALEETKQMTLE